MLDDKPLIQFKSINLSQVQRRIDKILTNTRAHYNTEPTGESFDNFVHDLYECFPPMIRYDVLFASVMDLVGKELTRDVIRQVAWRLAGNIGALRRNHPIPPWARQTELEWCPITIVRANKGTARDGKLGFFYEYRVMAGQPAGLKFKTFWTIKYLRFVSRSMGFCKSRKANFRLSDGLEMVQMRLYLLFDPKLSKEDRPVAFHFYVPASFKKYNQEIMKQRVRITPCPLGYHLHEMACHHCPLGYDQCPAACHPATFTTKGCPRCNKENWFDPLGRGVLCVDCEEHERRPNDSA